MGTRRRVVEVALFLATFSRRAGFTRHAKRREHIEALFSDHGGSIHAVSYG